MALVLTTTTGRIDSRRTEEFQARFRAMMGRRFEEAPFLRQAMLVDLGDGVWQMLTLWDSDLALTHTVDHEVPLTVRMFRDVGAEPEIRLGEVSAFLQPVPAQPAQVVPAQPSGLRVLEDDQNVPPRPEEEVAAATGADAPTEHTGETPSPPG